MQWRIEHCVAAILIVCQCKMYELQGRLLSQVFYTRLDGQHELPPPASSSYVVRDRGDCSPRCMRMTLNQVPVSADIRKVSAMPLGVVVCPLALPDPRDDPIQARHILDMTCLDKHLKVPMPCCELAALTKHAMCVFVQYHQPLLRSVCAACQAAFLMFVIR